MCRSSHFCFLHGTTRHTRIKWSFPQEKSTFVFLVHSPCSMVQTENEIKIENNKEREREKGVMEVVVEVGIGEGRGA